VKQWSKGGIHGFLKCSRGTSEAKGHDNELKLAEVGLKGHFKLFARLQQYLVETGAEIQLGEPRSITQLI
jgi:hypothetical protein